MRFADSPWRRGPGDLRKTNEPVTTVVIKHRVSVVKYGGAVTGDDDEKYTGDGGGGKVEAAIYDSSGHAAGVGRWKI